MPTRISKDDVLVEIWYRQIYDFFSDFFVMYSGKPEGRSGLAGQTFFYKELYMNIASTVRSIYREKTSYK